jgi:hypothetical protein
VIQPDFPSPALAEILREFGIDLADLKGVLSSRELAVLLGVTPGSLAQDRYRGCGIPYVKIGRRVRYLGADVARYLVSHRAGGDGTL